jgi:glycosyltransferase involved in cell wall biosynthesis
MSIRIAILWTGWSGYMEACYRELASRPSVELFVCMQKENGAAPFDPNCFSPKPNLLLYEDRPDAVALGQRLSELKPNVVLICSWHTPEYRHAARFGSGRFVRVLGMDNQWRGTAKQMLGILAFRTIWRDLYDVALVPGPRQYAFARMLGFADQAIRLGFCPCDVESFSRVALRNKRHRWLFVGRDTPEKGLDLLFAAYRQYRSTVDDPWPLVIVGGHQGGSAQEGIEYKGFVQPDALAEIFGEVAALILPSRF